MMNAKWIFRLVLLMSCVCAAWGAKYTVENPLRILLWTDNVIQDLSWAYEHNNGRMAIDWALPGIVKTTLANTTEPQADTAAGRAYIAEMAATGLFDMIISTGAVNPEPAAEQFPHIYFLGVSYRSTKTTRPPNVAYVFGRIEQIRYVTGVLVGLSMQDQQSGVVGYIGSAKIAEVYRGINAFYSGMQSVWPQGVLKVIWTNAFADSDLSAYTAGVLVDTYGAEMITHHMNDLTGLQRAAFKNVKSIGYQSDQGPWVSNYVLTSCMWNWSSAYISYTETILNDAWESNDVFLSVSTGVAKLGTWSPLVPQALRDQVEAVVQTLVDGSFDIFCGADADPWRTNSTGECLSTEEMYNMLSLYPDIVDLGDIAIPLTLVVVSSGLRAAMQALAAIGLAAVVTFMVLVVVYRATNVIRYSSPVFCLTMLLGSAIIYASVFVLSVDPPMDGDCNAVWWLLCVGFGMFYAALLVKTWRMAEIFRNLRHLRSKTVSGRTLLSVIAAIVGMELILLILLTAIDMPYARKIRQDQDASLGTYEYRVVCHQTTSSEALLWVLVAYNGMLLAVGVFLSFQTRSISKTFNESKHIAAGIYAFAAMLAICVPLVAISTDYVARYWITALGILLSTTTAVFVFFGPKFYIVFSGQDANFNPFQRSAASTPIGSNSPSSTSRPGGPSSDINRSTADLNTPSRTE